MRIDNGNSVIEFDRSRLECTQLPIYHESKQSLICLMMCYCIFFQMKFNKFELNT